MAPGHSHPFAGIQEGEEQFEPVVGVSMLAVARQVLHGLDVALDAVLLLIAAARARAHHVPAEREPGRLERDKVDVAQRKLDPRALALPPPRIGRIEADQEDVLDTGRVDLGRCGARHGRGGGRACCCC